MTGTRIDLGLASTVRLGRLVLSPAVRRIRRDDGAEEIVEPRVMQVLLALVDARGEIVRRAELTERCWNGRVVGEDAINRILSRLRRVAEGIGSGSFQIETVTRIGYRLLELDACSATARPAEPMGGAPLEAASAHRPLPNRRVALGGAVAAGLALAGGGVWWRARQPKLPARAREAMDRGMEAFRLTSVEQFAVAAAAFHEAAELAPDAAEPWGKLALAHRFLWYSSHGQEAAFNAGRARDAADNALRIDPANTDARAVLATLQPEFRNWLAFDRACRPFVDGRSDHIGVDVLYIDLLSNVGRIREVNQLARRLIAEDARWPTLHKDLILSSWCLGELDAADAACDRALQRWPREIGVWFIRQRLLAFSGRAAAALVMAEDVDHRPIGLPAWDFDLSIAEARALMTRSPTDIDVASKLYRSKAPSSIGVASNAAGFFAEIGRLNDAFAFVEAIYFGKGFAVADRFFTEEQAAYSERRNLPTWQFWLPMMAKLRADPRTATIVEKLGLVDYWRKAGTGPDFRIAGLKLT